MFIHVSIMIFVGFGFLMTFLKRYGYSAIGYNFMLSCFAFLWNILVPFPHYRWPLLPSLLIFTAPCCSVPASGSTCITAAPTSQFE
jgi:hypothetical protein